MTNTIYVTTAIPYVNAEPHVGFALELVQADVIARYYRLLGKNVRFQTGTDENAFKNVLAARAQGIETQLLVDRNAALYRSLVEALGISVDRFIRTSEPAHFRAVADLWHRLRPGDLYRKRYAGLYCIGCEDFWLPRDLVNGLCPDHGAAPVPVAEENWFFRLSAYRDEIDRLIQSDRLRVVPATRKAEVLAFVRRGLQDFSVSRAADRAGGWGIPVPNDPTQVIYVWIDALINYISGLGFGTSPDWANVWNAQTRKIHVIGKNVWKFHAVYWPALLLSAGLPHPSEVVVHGFLTAEGQKISKSLGNVIDPFAWVKRFGADAVRYYLLRAVRPFEDADVSGVRLAQLYRTDLADGLGNLVSRLATLCERCEFGALHTSGASDAPPGFHAALGRFEYDEALRGLWTAFEDLNRDIERRQPWKLLSAGDFSTLETDLTSWLTRLAAAAYWLQVFLPETSARVRSTILADPIRAPRPLFPRGA